MIEPFKDFAELRFDAVEFDGHSRPSTGGASHGFPQQLPFSFFFACNIHQGTSEMMAVTPLEHLADRLLRNVNIA